jgi:hypothetical protein
MSEHSIRSADNTTTAATSEGAGQTRHFWNSKHFTHTVSLLLMALATLGTSWSGFQSSLWNGTQTFRLADSTRLGRLAAEERVVANQHRNLDAAIFMEYCEAISSENHKLSEFMRARVRPEAEPAMSAWIATRPMQTRDAPTSPFVMPEYHLKEEQDAANHDSESEAMYNAAQAASTNGDNYTLLAMLFAISLFIAGLVTGFEGSGKQWIAIALSLCLILFSGAILLRLPIAH